MKKFALSLAICTAIFSFNSCNKVEGPGGSSTIKGTIKIQNQDGAGNVISEYMALEEDVYLVYGSEDTFYDDDVKTSFDGSFEFNFLQKGTYQIFVYQDCNSCASGEEAVIKTIEIANNKSTEDVGEITIIK